MRGPFFVGGKRYTFGGMSKPTRLIKAVPKKKGHWFYLRNMDGWGRVSKEWALHALAINDAELVVGPSGMEIREIIKLNRS